MGTDGERTVSFLMRFIITGGGSGGILDGSPVSRRGTATGQRS
jgi:hypothetical protein